MTPLYFGTRQRLFGVIHAPGSATATGAGMVLCPGYGHDALYALRAFRTLAARLTRGGMSVLRFDYSGTGDSIGDIEEGSISEWTADVSDAIDRIRSEGASTVCLLGYRLGGLVATLTAARIRGISRLVLWDPIVDGTSYVAALRKCHHNWFRKRAHQIPRSRQLETAEDLLGFRFPAGLRADIEAMDLRNLQAKPADNALIIGTVRDEAHAEFSTQLSKLGTGTDLRYVEDQALPSMEPGLQIGLVPNRILTEIDAWLKELHG